MNNTATLGSYGFLGGALLNILSKYINDEPVSLREAVITGLQVGAAAGSIGLVIDFVETTEQPQNEVYRITNKTRKEIYHGVAYNAEERFERAHEKGKTKSLEDWDFENDSISLEVLSTHKDRSEASKISHQLERLFEKRGYTNILTSGI